MPKYIKKKDLKNAIDECTWYHIGKGGELVEGANSSEHEPLYKYSDIKEIIKNLPTRKFETEPKRTALSKALKWTYGDEPNCSEKPNNCETCRYESLASYEGACDDCTDMDGRPTNYEPKTEPLDKDTNVRSKDCETCGTPRHLCKYCIEEDRMWTPQTDLSAEEFVERMKNLKMEVKRTDCDRYAIVNDESERAYNCIGCQTDCPWK